MQIVHVSTCAGLWPNRNEQWPNNIAFNEPLSFNISMAPRISRFFKWKELLTALAKDCGRSQCALPTEEGINIGQVELIRVL